MYFTTELFFDIMFKSKVVSDSETRIPHVLAVVLFHNFVQLDRRHGGGTYFLRWHKWLAESVSPVARRRICHRWHSWWRVLHFQLSAAAAVGVESTVAAVACHRCNTVVSTRIVNWVTFAIFDCFLSENALMFVVFVGGGVHA